MNGKNLLRKLIAAGISVFMALSIVSMAACSKNNNSENNNETTEDETTEGETTEGETTDSYVSTPLSSNNKIYVVGDSTVCSFTDNYYMPRYGYGTQLSVYLNCTDEQIVNLALSGRSSLSFLSESNYETLTSSISEGDYLIIGFGHNDEKDSDVERYTDPTKSYTDSDTSGTPSFQYVLYNYYVKVAEDAGATAILCTPIVRYDSTGAYTGSVVHNTSSGDYSAAIRTLGEETDTTVIDLTSLTKAVYMADNDAAQLYHAYTTYEGTKPTETPSGMDTTHINKYGAQMVAYQFANALLKTDNPLAANVRENISAPTDYTIAINEDYVKPDYTSFDGSQYESNKLATIETTTQSTWYKTAMGYISNVSNFTETYSDDTFTISNTGGQGKFASGSDGFAAAFMQVDITKNFTVSVTATVTAFNDSISNFNQAGFGLMLRDDIYVDTVNNSIASNYVAAGMLMDGKTIFSRENTTLSYKTTTIAPSVGSSYEMTIVRNGQVVTVAVKIGDSTYTQTYTDFDFASVDNNYMYICLFANRGVTATFTNLSFEITGDAQGA